MDKAIDQLACSGLFSKVSGFEKSEHLVMVKVVEFESIEVLFSVGEVKHDPQLVQRLLINLPLPVRFPDLEHLVHLLFFKVHILHRDVLEDMVVQEIVPCREGLQQKLLIFVTGFDHFRAL